MKLMVIGDFHFACVICLPTENNAPLVVDTNGMVSGEISSQEFQTVSRRIAEVVEGFRRMDRYQLVIRTLLDFLWNFAGKGQIENLLALLVSEAKNHGHKILKFAYNARKQFSKQRISL